MSKRKRTPAERVQSEMPWAAGNPHGAALYLRSQGLEISEIADTMALSEAEAERLLGPAPHNLRASVQRFAVQELIAVINAPITEETPVRIRAAEALAKVAKDLPDEEMDSGLLAQLAQGTDLES